MNIITRLTGSPVRKSARLSVVLPRTIVINIYPIYTKQSIDKMSLYMCCYCEHAKQAVSSLFRRLFDQTCFRSYSIFWSTTAFISHCLLLFAFGQLWDAVPKISTINVNKERPSEVDGGWWIFTAHVMAGWHCWLWCVCLIALRSIILSIHFTAS